MKFVAELKAGLSLPGAPPPGRWSPTQIGALAAVMVLAAVLAWLGRLPDLSTGGDESLYILLSRSLAAGHYRDTYLPGAPLHAHFPPGMPVWLLLVRSVAGAALDTARAANLILLLGSGLLLADGLRRVGHRWLGIAAASLVVWNPGLLQITMTLHSEALFVFLAVLACWAALRADSRSGWGWPLLAVFAAIAAFMTRTAGLGVVAGIGLWALATKRWQVAGLHAIAAGAAVAGWFLHLRAATPLTQAGSYLQDLETARAGLPTLFTRLGSGVVYYLGTGVPNLLRLPMVPDTPMDNLAWLVVLGGSGLVGALLLARSWPAAAAQILGSVAVMLWWIYRVERLMLPLLPWLATCILLGAWCIGRRRSPVSGAWAAGLVWALLAGFSLTDAVKDVQAAQQCDRVDQYARPGCVNDNEREYMLAVRSLRTILPPEAVVATVKPSLLAYASGRRAVPLYRIFTAPLRVGDDGTFDGTSITHILLSRFNGMDEINIARHLLPHCTQLTVQAELGPGELLLAPRQPTATTDACLTLGAIAAKPLPEE